jgi:hypothetical protein
MTSRTLVRIPCRSNAEAEDLALRLQADGYRAVRRWKAVIARTETSAQAVLLAEKLGQPATMARSAWRIDLVAARTAVGS